ncbi:MAG: ABC transporter ATP-binding protein [Clostridia bacterium]|nr:ABC transporter ATP-binding protein [Clostridia bacterium]
MIEIKNLSKSYGDNVVYDNFNLSLKEKEVTCILGESGSGKTTLLNCIAGLTEYGGERLAVNCSYIFQSPRLVPNLTVYGNLALVCNDREKITELLRRVHLEDKANAYPVTLSGGQAQRVAIARAFLFKSEIILMDEPFSSLDLKLKLEMYELFYEILRESGRTALYVTHDLDEALSIAQRVIVIKHGEIVYDKPVLSPAPRAYGTEDNIRRELIAALTQNA